jgi:hypothetical protein
VLTSERRERGLKGFIHHSRAVGEVSSHRTACISLLWVVMTSFEVEIVYVKFVFVPRNASWLQAIFRFDLPPLKN